jgi:sugar phosphate isomerase/epimerase
VQLSITTDYAAGTGDPSPYLRGIAEAGFTHVHWCHQWSTDFLYSECEIRQIGVWLAEFGLELLDLHGSVGPEKNWASEREYERLAGVELVRNRLYMTARLGGGATILHVPNEPVGDPLRRSLDAVQEFCKERGVCIAIENRTCFDATEQVLSEYGPETVGLCYDCGHGNMIADGLERLGALKDRLISVHLHDNDGIDDQHMIPFTGTVDWSRLARIMATSAYTKPVSMEVSTRNAGIDDEEVFLKKTFDAGVRLTEMVDKERAALEQA